jgi:quinol-cytochrome oxidoreductase complex cytochrome b subunit
VWPPALRLDLVKEDHVLAYDYPLLGVFWSLLMLSLFVIWIFIVIWCFIDNFRRIDHGGWAKFWWTIFIIFMPFIGVLSYILTRPVDPYAIVVADDVV